MCKRMETVEVIPTQFASGYLDKWHFRIGDVVTNQRWAVGAHVSFPLPYSRVLLADSYSLVYLRSMSDINILFC